MTDAPVEETPRLRWDWSPEAMAAFTRETGLLKIPRLSAGLSAALEVEAPRIFEAQVEGMIHAITAHPVLGGRILRLKAGPDGLCHLKLDADLLHFILFDEMPAEEGRSCDHETVKLDGTCTACGIRTVPDA